MDESPFIEIIATDLKTQVDEILEVSDFLIEKS